MTSETERAEAALDFSARMMTVLQPLMNQVGIDFGKATIFIATQAISAGMSDADFAKVCVRAVQHGQEFEAAAEGVINGAR